MSGKLIFPFEWKEQPESHANVLRQVMYIFTLALNIRRERRNGILLMKYYRVIRIFQARRKSRPIVKDAQLTVVFLGDD